ncbi:MAG: S-layer homology domain-containing protein [Clostridia bacterium]|nr:S-layer homology domain-containing protein [Clostridia bacterium]
MRKMNKIVALSLVLAMALSMMASAANFKDQATINTDLVDEINLLVALGVYSEQGTGDGYFEPNMTITRAQAAKIMYVLKNKGVDNGATSWTGLNIFKDVEAGAWYEGYANYCASTGIMIGTGEGNFTPNGKLTGTELAKMLLVLIGYKSDIEGYAGNGWDANILADAEEAGLLEEYNLPVKGIVTREWAAQMIVNALYANKVKYSDGVAEEMYSNYVENNQIVSRPVTYAGQDLGLLEVTAVAIGTPKFTLDAEGAPVLHPDNKTSKIMIGEEISAIAYEITEDQLAQEVKVLYKDSDSFAGLTKDDKIYGVTATGTSKVYNVNLADITVSATNSTIKFAGYNNGEAKKYEGNNLAVMTYNNMYAKEANIVSMLGKLTNTPYAAKLVDVDGDGYIDVMFGVVPTIAKVTALNAAKNVLTIKDAEADVLVDINTEANFKKVNFVDEIAKNDIVAGIYDYSEGKEILNLTKVDSVEGKITKLNKNASGVVTSYIIDGTTYKTASNYMEGATKPAGLTTNEETFYVEGNYVVFSEIVTNSADQENIVLFLKANSADGVFATKQVQVMDATGTKTIYDYNVISSNAPKGYVAFADLKVEGVAYEAVISEGTIYFKELNTTNDGEKATGSNIVYEDAKIALDSKTDKYTITDGTIVVDDADVTHELAATQIAADDAVFFIKNDKGWKVFKASELTSDFAGDAAQFIVSKSGVPTIKMAVVTIEGETYPTDSTTDAVYGILASTYTQYTVDNTTKYDITITLMDGTTKTITTEEVPAVKQLVSFTENSKGVATVAATNVLYGNLEAFTGNTLYVNGEFMTLADDAKVYFVDFKDATTDTFTVAEGTGLVAAAEGVEGTNILYKMNTAGTKIATIFVEVDGEAIDTDAFVLVDAE